MSADDTVVSFTRRPARRTVVPAPVVAGGTSAALDELTGGDVPRLVHIPLERLHPHPDNPRRDVGDVTELAADIAANGLDQALVVVPHPDRPGDYRIVIGHRRLAAAQLACVPEVTARIRGDLTAASQRQMMVRENVHRADLTAVEEADAYQAMLDVDGLDVAGIAAAVSRSETTVRSRLRLAALPDTARHAVHIHAATLDDAAALEEFDDDPTVVENLAADLGTKNWQISLVAARRRRETARAFAPFIDRLRAANAPEISGTGWGTPVGFTRAASTSTWNLASGQDSGVWNLSAEALGKALDDVTTGWVWRVERDELSVFRPLTLEELAEQDARAARSAGVNTANAEADAEFAARKAKEAALREFADVTATTRAEFLEHLIHDRKPTSTQQVALVAFAGAADPTDNSLEVDAAVQTAIRQLDPTRRLLVALAVASEPISAAGWNRTYGMARATTAWYALLEDLGYAVSDAERAQLAVLAGEL
ncbi:MAG TPA: ParB/RepB/Spo0J family partition protein [Cellulomonadaceae bacterium]|nr:ParB/RepB/Spo0J family partition protein [Cellulomonadaceae bacterium]